MRFFFSLPRFLVIIIDVVIGVVRIREIVANVVVDIGIGISESGFLTITVVPVSDNNIK